jgi:hypothetical protein
VVKTCRCFFACLLFIGVYLQIEAEDLRILVAGSLEVSRDNPPASVSLAYNNSVVIILGEGARFFRGVELELSAPQRWLPYQGSLAAAAYAELDRAPKPGTADIKGRRFFNDPLPGKLQIVYQIPLRPGHGLRSSPYATVPAGIVPRESFPIVFRIMPVVKGLSEELETMRFQLSVKPILGEEGTVRIGFRYPEQLAGKPLTVLVDDAVVENPGEEQFLKEGEHHLVILSDDYRNENRRFLIERAKVLDLTIELQDPTPLIVFEAPENARIFLDNEPIALGRTPVPVEPGPHEVRFQISDYAIVRQLTVQRGKTYRVAMAVDVNISESE